MPWSCLQGSGCGRLAGRCGLGGHLQKVWSGGASSAREEAGPCPPKPCPHPCAQGAFQEVPWAL